MPFLAQSQSHVYVHRPFITNTLHLGNTLTFERVLGAALNVKGFVLRNFKKSRTGAKWTGVSRSERDSRRIITNPVAIIISRPRGPRRVPSTQRRAPFPPGRDEDRDIGRSLRKWRLDGVKNRRGSRAKLHPSYLSIPCQMNSRRSPIDRLIFPAMNTIFPDSRSRSSENFKCHETRLCRSLDAWRSRSYFNLRNGAASITMVRSAQPVRDKRVCGKRVPLYVTCISRALLSRSPQRERLIIARARARSRSWFPAVQFLPR